MKNHAFIIPVHTQPFLLARVLKILQASNHYFFIHVDGNVRNYEQFRQALSSIEKVCFLDKRYKTYHSRIGCVYATIAMLNEVEAHPVHFDYIHQISGQDYPLRSNQQCDDFFESTEDSFMYYTLGKERDYIIDQKKVNGWYLNTTTTFLDNILLRGGYCLGKIIKRPPIPNYCGAWDWFSWSETVYSFVLNYLKENPQFLKRFNHTLIPSEHIFATMLKPYLAELKIRERYPLRYVSWLPHRPISSSYRPFNLTEEDYEYVLASPCFFCRKIHEEESAKLLEMIDSQRGSDFDITNYSEIY